MGELVGGMARGLGADVGFTVGLLSALDLLLDAPMEDAIETLPLDAETRLALVEGKGPLGEIIACIRGFETGNPPASVLGLDHDKLANAYMEAVAWSIANCGSIVPPTKSELAAPPAQKQPVQGWTEVQRSSLQAEV
jgi:EAL and modified HD-GYP domain-containing signal transduction protein